MRLWALLLGLLSPLTNAGVFGTESVQEYPSSWPKLSGMSDTCVEVQGTFIDTNRWRWEHEEIPGSPLGSKYGGTREAAWIVFGLPAQDVHSEDRRIKSRAFTITIDQDKTVTINYLIDQKVVTSKSFTKNKWSCGKDGLTIITLDRSGEILDKVPNHGRTIRRTNIYRMHEHLYVNTINEAKTRVIYVIPRSFLSVAWFRFPELTP